MTGSLFLSSDDIYDLTGFKRYSSQIEALRFMGITHRIRADGSPAVLKEHVNSIFGGISQESAKLEVAEPNWRALN